MSHNRQKKIAVINELCGFGKCSISVSLPVISAMKIQCCPLPTAIFSDHTGFESFYSTDFTEHMEPYMDEWAKLGLRFNGILTGFLGSVTQIETVKRFMRLFKTDECCVVIDPVMGDNGKLYPTYPESLALKMRELLPYADILTPNLTEVCILTDTEYRPDISDSELEKLCEKLCDKGAKSIVVSGLDRGDTLENFIYRRGKPSSTVIETKAGPCRSGTGDVFSSIVCGSAVNGLELEQGVRLASSFIAKALRLTVKTGLPGTDGICFEPLLWELGKE